MALLERLRPIERRVLTMHREGIDTHEIAHRFRVSPEHVRRVIDWTGIRRNAVPKTRRPRAMEQRVVALRADGETYEQIGNRFKRSPRFIRQVEGITHVVNGTTTAVKDRGTELLRDAADQARETEQSRS